MRQAKALEYFMTKLSVLHRTTELNNLDRFFSDEKTESRDVYRGFHIFPSKSVVMSRYKEGKPLSCFVLNNHKDEVHVPFFEKNDRSQNQLSYATFSYDTTVATIKESGVHFCKFVCEDTHSAVDRNVINITDYAIMLPYFREQTNNRPRLYQYQYSLIYSDWEVLQIDLPPNHKKKGPATAECKEILEFIRHLQTK